MSSRAEMRGDDSVDLNKPLSVLSRFEPPHPSLPFPGRLMRILSTVVQVPMLSMGYAGHYNSFRRRIAP